MSSNFKLNFKQFLLDDIVKAPVPIKIRFLKVFFSNYFKMSFKVEYPSEISNFSTKKKYFCVFFSKFIRESQSENHFLKFNIYL